MYSMLVDKIDSSGDGEVSSEELEDWIRHVARRYVYEDVNNVWDSHDTDKDGFVDYQEYKDISFGVIDGESLSDTKSNVVSVGNR